MSRSPFTLAVGIAGVAVAILTAALTLGEPDGGVVSYGAASPGAAVIEMLAGVALFAAATLVASDGRRRGLALSTFALGLAWAAAPWAGWTGAPAAVRSLAILLVPTVPAFALLVGATLFERRRARFAAAALAGVALAVDGLLWLVRDPLLDRYCWRDCLAETGAPFVDVDRARTVTNVSLAFGIACGVALAGIALAALLARTSIRRSDAAALVAAIPLGGVIAASALALRLVPAEDPNRPLHALFFGSRGLALIGFAGGLSVLALRPRAVRHAITRLAEEPGRVAGGDLGEALAAALEDPSVRIGYPLADGRLVDASGDVVSLGAEPVRVLRGSEVVALVGSTADVRVSTAAVDRALGPSARLALGNERLRAEQLVRLQELTALRRRIVATGDAERRRLERDLHDGAQQRLLALSFDIRVALSRAESASLVGVVAELRDALGALGEATEQLRTIAHGIFPAVLSSSGLVAALETLADTTPLLLRSEIDESARYPPGVETAVYAIAAEAVAGARSPVRVSLVEMNAELLVTVADAPWHHGAVGVEDRVGAVGGTVRWSERMLEAVLPLSVRVGRPYG